MKEGEKPLINVPCCVMGDENKYVLVLTTQNLYLSLLGELSEPNSVQTLRHVIRSDESNEVLLYFLNNQVLWLRLQKKEHVHPLTEEIV